MGFFVFFVCVCLLYCCILYAYFFLGFLYFVASFPSVLWYCWLGLSTCKTVFQITYTVLVETLDTAQSISLPCRRGSHLSVDDTSAPSLLTFRKRLKLHLFRLSTFIPWPSFYKLTVSLCGPCGSSLLLRPP